MRRRMLPGSLEEQHPEEEESCRDVHPMKGPQAPILLNQGKLEPSALNRHVGDYS